MHIDTLIICVSLISKPCVHSTLLIINLINYQSAQHIHYNRNRGKPPPTIFHTGRARPWGKQSLLLVYAITPPKKGGGEKILPYIALVCKQLSEQSLGEVLVF